MGRRALRLQIGAPLLATALAFLAMALHPSLVTANGPGCSVIGTSSSGGTVDLLDTVVWHLRSADHVSVVATAPSPQSSVNVGVSILGFTIPIVSGTTDGEVTTARAEVEVATFAALGRVFVVWGSSAGEFGSCGGEVLIVIDDVSALGSPLGIAAAAAAVIGLIGLVLAVRKPASPWRRGASLVALLLAIAGASVLVQQTWSGESAVLDASAFADSVLSAQQLSWDPLTLAQAGGLTLLLVIAMPFPAELFNKTLEANLDEIRAAVRRLPVLGALMPAAHPSPPGLPSDTRSGTTRAGAARALGIVAFVAVAGLLYSFLDPGFGPTVRSAITFGGMIAALLTVVWLHNLPLRASHRSATGDGGRLEAALGTLGIAAACVAISRLTGFLPGYLYGLVFGYVFVVELGAARHGRALAAGATWMVGLALAGWLMLGALRVPGVDGTVPGEIGQSVLAAVAVAGIEGIVFALVPLRFLPGAAVYRWSRMGWGLLYAIGLFAFVVVILNPANGFVRATSHAGFGTAAVLFIGFGLSSVLFWAYFRFRGRGAAV